MISKYLITESPLPHKKIRLVSGSYNGNITPLDVSNSTITMGSSKQSGVRKLYCLSDIFEKPVVNTSPCRRNMALVALVPYKKEKMVFMSDFESRNKPST